jgi:hypothetical protein
VGGGGRAKSIARTINVRRDVAVTMVPDAFVHDPERLAPFERERAALSREPRVTPSSPWLFAVRGSPCETEGHDSSTTAIPPRRDPPQTL